MNSSALPPCTQLLQCHHGPFITAPAHFHRAPCAFTTITVPSSELQCTTTVHRAPSLPSQSHHPSYSALPPCTMLLQLPSRSLHPSSSALPPCTELRKLPSRSLHLSYSAVPPCTVLLQMPSRSLHLSYSALPPCTKLLQLPSR